MRRKRNMISKAGVLLISALMVFSAITVVIADTSDKPEIITPSETIDGVVLPEDAGINSGHAQISEPRVRKVVSNPVEKFSDAFGGGGGLSGPFTFHQQVISDTGAWSFINMDGSLGYGGIDNFYGLPSGAKIETVSFVGLAIHYSGGWVTHDPATEEFSVDFYSQASTDHTMPPSGLVAHFDIGIGDYTYTTMPGSYSGFTAYEWTFDLPTDVALEDGWIQIVETNVGGMWGNSHDGDMFSYQIGVGQTTDGDRAFTLEGITSAPCKPGVCDLQIVNVNNIEDGATINSIPKIINLTVNNAGQVGIIDAKILVDIYEKVCGEITTIFDDDMESYDPLTQDDNVNWTPIDNGDDDTWTLYCDEGHSGSQAYRCTLGKYRDPCAEDTYLGHAADGTNDILQMDNPLPLWGAACTTVSFWHKCTGEYSTDENGVVTPIDFGTLEYSLDAGSSWIGVPGFIAYDNPWQQITVKITDPAVHDLCEACNDDVDFYIEADLSSAQLLVRFVWQVDPSQQYEGWYIDDVKVERIEKYMITGPVWQGWQILQVPPCTFGMFVDFPLEFTGLPDTCYQLDVIAQVFDGCDDDLSNNDLTLQFCIADVHDMAAVSITGPVAMQDGDNGVYDVTVQNVGTFAENNVPVVLKVSKAELMSGNSLDDDFETSPTDWLTGWFVGAQPKSLWKWSTYDAHSGTHSMICGNDANMLEPNLGCLLLPDMAFDLRDSNILSSTLEYNIKWSIPDDGAWEDYFGIGFGHPSSNWVVTTTWTPFMGGYDNEWRGPQNPGPWPVEMFQWDLKALMADFTTYYPSIFPDAQFEMYFVMATNGNTNILNADNPEYWSGVRLDDVKVETLRASSTSSTIVDTQTTGILNPGEVQTLTMNWNDSQYCNWAVSGETQLATDIDHSNDVTTMQTIVRDRTMNIAYDSIDLTGYPVDSLWHIVAKQHNFGPEPPTDSYWWCGEVYSTWAGYANNLDDSLISEQIDLSGTEFDNGAVFTFDTWYEFADSGDYGEVYYSVDNGTTWNFVNRFTHSTGVPASDWHVVAYGIPASDCTDEVRLKFRMVSDDSGTSNGWYIDSLDIGYLQYDRSIFSEGFNMDNRWTKDPAHSDNWGTSNTNNAGGTAPEMEFYYYPSFVDTTWLELDPVDTSGYATLDLSALTYVDDYAGGYTIEVRTDDGTDAWTNVVYSVIVAGTGQHDVGPITLTAADGIGSANFGIRFYFIGDSYDINNWYIDDIALGSVLFEDFSPSAWIPGWTLLPYNTDGNNRYVLYGMYIATTWDHGLPPLFGIAVPEGNDCAGLCWDTDSYFGIAAQDEHMQTPVLSYTLASGESLGMTFLSYNAMFEPSMPEQDLIKVFDGTSWNTVADLAQMSDNSFDTVFISLPGDTQQVDFHRVSPYGGYSVWFVDDMDIGVYAPTTCYSYEFEESEGFYRANGWMTHSNHAGDFWQQDISCPFGDYDGDGLAHGCIDYPTDGTGLNDVLYTTIDLTDENLTYAGYEFAIEYLIDGYNGCMAYVEISGDYDPSENMAESSADWKEVVTSGGYDYSGGWISYEFDLSAYLGGTVTVRFRLTTPGNDLFVPYAYSDAGYWVDGFTLITKEKPPATDELPPVTVDVFDEVAGTVTLLAADQAGPVVSGVAATFYILDGGATTEYTVPITLTEGSHTLVYWSVDNVGNEESHHTKTYTVDTTPPTVTITEPEEGALYLFGNKVMDRILGTTTICIGKITIEADASDAGGISMVTFNVNNDTGYDTDGSDGYTYLFSKRYFGPVDVTVTAYDNSGLSAEATTSFTIYSFGVGI